MQKLTAISINENIEIEESHLRILHENTSSYIPNSEKDTFATRWNNGHFGQCKLDCNTHLFANLFDIFARGLGYFSLTLGTDQISWSVARDKKGAYFFQFRNETPIPGFPVPIHSWGYKTGNNRKLRVHSPYKKLPTLPQCHFLKYSHTVTLIDAFTELKEFREKENEKYFDPVHWEDTGTCSPNLRQASDAEWNAAIDYQRDPQYDKYFAR